MVTTTFGILMALAWLNAVAIEDLHLIPSANY